MIKLKSAVLVEGKYDKIRLSGIVDGLILTTDGFAVFKNKEKLAMLKAVADKCGLIVLTDSDSAGMFIRNRLKGIIDEKNIINVYLPSVPGKEKRKARPSKEGLLGVEGTDNKIIEDALKKYACNREDTPDRKIEKSDFYEWGLTGLENSAFLRDRIKKQLSLPDALTSNGLLEVANVLYGYEEFKKICDGVKMWEKQPDKK